jgi:hypothetical protein
MGSGETIVATLGDTVSARSTGAVFEPAVIAELERPL